MDFGQFKIILQNHFSHMIEDNKPLFVTNVNKDDMWDLYLNSFPPGTNEIFREKREYDCSCCRHFIKSFGNVVTINDNQLVSIWDCPELNDDKFKVVTKALSKFVKTKEIQDVFVTKESSFGVDKNFEKRESGEIITWEHFYVKLPKQYATRSSDTVPTIIGNYRDIRNVFKRSLEEISNESVECILDLISQKSLYKGEEWQSILNQFLQLKKEYNDLSDRQKEIFCWDKSIKVGPVIGKIKNHSIGTLLVDITDGIDLNDAVRKYESIVAPINYKRPKAIFTQKMIDDARKTIEELGIYDSLERRFACIEDITVNNILFANKDSIKKMMGGIFDDLKQNAKKSPLKFDKLQEVPIEKFVSDMLPRIKNMEVYVENKHKENFVSLIAPKNQDSKNIFKWNNNFSWAYNGNITDSMKDRVKRAGGKVDGVLRFSLQWNEDGNSQNDLDAHCIEPNKNHIFFGNKRSIHSGGMLDVDIIYPQRDKIAIENITWNSTSNMKEGIYTFYVHNYSMEGTTGGFRAEIEYEGQIHEFDYQNYIKGKENIAVAKVEYNKKTGFKLIQSLPSTASSQNIWNVNTNEFNQVSVLMYSPNYWDEQNGIGNKHYFFMLNNCINDNTPNGFFNEFLQEDLMKHKRVFEALGNKMKVEKSDNQLSGVGFSSTKQNSLICKVDGNTSRIIKILF